MLSFKFTLALAAVLGQGFASPLITQPPTPVSSAALSAETIPLGQCLTSVVCCQSTMDVPTLPVDSLTSILPLPSGIPIPTLGPKAGFVCTSATDLDILGNQCLAGGTPLCCQIVLPLGVLAEGCQDVINPVLPTIPGLPTSLPISIPGLPTSLPISIPGLPTSLPISLPGLSDSLPISIPDLPTSLPTSLPISIPDLPTSLPISIPDLPTSLPTSLPISLPDLPTSLPISLPIIGSSSSSSAAALPTSLPVSLPTSLPISLPTSLPISLPTSLPISLPTSLPIGLPTGLPINL